MQSPFTCTQDPWRPLRVGRSSAKAQSRCHSMQDPWRAVRVRRNSAKIQSRCHSKQDPWRPLHVRRNSVKIQIRCHNTQDPWRPLRVGRNSARVQSRCHCTQDPIRTRRMYGVPPSAEDSAKGAADILSSARISHHCCMVLMNISSASISHHCCMVPVNIERGCEQCCSKFKYRTKKSNSELNLINTEKKSLQNAAVGLLQCCKELLKRYCCSARTDAVLQRSDAVL